LTGWPDSCFGLQRLHTDLKPGSGQHEASCQQTPLKKSVFDLYGNSFGFEASVFTFSILVMLGV
jgi:hypothetical protein